jgi:hypothetical protein
MTTEPLPLIEEPRVQAICHTIACRRLGINPLSTPDSINNSDDYHLHWINTFVAVASAVGDDIWTFGEPRESDELQELRYLCQTLTHERKPKA